MTIFDFDELNSFKEFREELLSMKPSEVMDQKERIRDRVGWLLEFAYMLGFDRAKEELGSIAEDLKPFLPSDYTPQGYTATRTEGSSKLGGYSTENRPLGNGSNRIDTALPKADSTTGELNLPKDYDQRMQEAVWKEIKGKNFSDRVLEHAELGDKQAILKVVETDGNRVYNSGGLLGARGKAKFKTWETMMDDRVREQHSYLQSVTVPIDEDFYTYDGDHAPQPGGFEDPALNINCRCTLSFSK